jgi:hypothetical protein
MTHLYVVEAVHDATEQHGSRWQAGRARTLLDIIPGKPLLLVAQHAKQIEVGAQAVVLDAADSHHAQLTPKPVDSNHVLAVQRIRLRNQIRELLIECCIIIGRAAVMHRNL